MIIEQDEQFRAERQRFRLRFTCEGCVNFDPSTEQCAHRYPTERHRERRYDDPEATLLFCKEFELL